MINRTYIIFLLIVVANVYTLAQDTIRHHVGGYCDGCDAMYVQMPKNLSWQTTIPDTSEPGEPLEIEGTIYKLDGKTPAPNVILYVYHTDAKGLYSPSKSLGTGARRHGHLRGWMKTDSSGRYKFRTIRPASYPNSRNPQHIHPVIKEPNRNEYYFDEYLFEDDPLIPKEERNRSKPRCGPGIVTVTKGKDGLWRGKRDIILGLNVPDYK
jgi:protocatechuate 3,4-dioxygenase beta subunit